MTKKYRVREEVNAAGDSTFYIECKSGFWFWETVREYSPELSFSFKKRFTTLEKAKKEIEKMKEFDARVDSLHRESKIVKTKYYGEEDV